MKHVLSIRTRLNLSQQQLADYLQVSRSAVNSYEMDLRSLPTSAVLKLLQMEIILSGTYPNDQALPPESLPHTKTANAEKLKRKLTLRMQRSLSQAATAERQLKAMKAMYEQAAAALPLLKQLATTVPQGNEWERDRLWMRIRQDELETTMIRNGMEAQLLLQCSMQTFTSDAEHARVALEALGR